MKYVSSLSIINVLMLHGKEISIILHIQQHFIFSEFRFHINCSLFRALFTRYIVVFPVLSSPVIPKQAFGQETFLVRVILSPFS